LINEIPISAILPIEHYGRLCQMLWRSRCRLHQLDDD